ncbi:unnamed protein product [Discosporangium mesarthrocarpum]
MAISLVQHLLPPITHHTLKSINYCGVESSKVSGSSECAMFSIRGRSACGTVPQPPVQCLLFISSFVFSLQFPLDPVGCGHLHMSCLFVHTRHRTTPCAQQRSPSGTSS